LRKKPLSSLASVYTNSENALARKKAKVWGRELALCRGVPAASLRREFFRSLLCRDEAGDFLGDQALRRAFGHVCLARKAGSLDVRQDLQ